MTTLLQAAAADVREAASYAPKEPMPMSTKAIITLSLTRYQAQALLNDLTHAEGTFDLRVNRIIIEALERALAAKEAGL